MEAVKIAVITETVPIFPQDTDHVLLRYLEKFQDYEVKNEVLVLENQELGTKRIVVPQGKVVEVLKTLHEPGHHGVKATKSRVKPLFYWPTLSKDVENFVKNCEICDEHRAPYYTENTAGRTPS